MSLISLEQYSEKQNRAINRVLDTLDRLDARTSAHYSEKRAHERKAFRGLVWLSIPDGTQEFDQAMTKVWSRSISQSGLSFIYPMRIYETQIRVGVPVGADQVTWFRAEIVRQKEVEEEHFWEYGVRFLGKVIA